MDDMYGPIIFIMSTIPFIKKRIGQSYLVWFQNSNLYILLEEPAWFVFRKTTKRYKAETIAKEFALRYGNTFGESISFVQDIRLGIEKMNREDLMQLCPGSFSDHLNEHKFIPFSTHHYRPGNKVIVFSYETRNLENYIHPLIRHFETMDENNKMDFFELFTFNERIVFRFNGEVKGEWDRNEAQFVKGRIFMFLINVLHDKTNEDWLMTVHASAITNGKKTILFTAPPGKGKTTFAALLHTRGYRLISDDFVPIDRQEFKAYPFPGAISIKEGSIALISSLFPALEQSPLDYITSERSVRYLPLNRQLDITKDVYPVKEIIFIQYDSSVDFSWKKLDTGSAVKLLFGQAWMAPLQGNAARLFDLVLRISFFQYTQQSCL